MNVVLDASAMIAFLRGEPGADIVGHYFEPQAHSLYTHALNLCELYCHFFRAVGKLKEMITRKPFHLVIPLTPYSGIN